MTRPESTLCGCDDAPVRSRRPSGLCAACASGQDQAYISRLELGVITDITIATLERLADALQTSADYLLGRGADDIELLAAAVA